MGERERVLGAPTSLLPRWKARKTVWVKMVLFADLGGFSCGDYEKNLLSLLDHFPCITNTNLFFPLDRTHRGNTLPHCTDFHCQEFPQ